MTDAENSAFNRYAACCVPEIQLESDAGTAVRVSSCFGTRGTLSLWDCCVTPGHPPVTKLLSFSIKM